MGACVLLCSDATGHLLVTSRHVVDGVNWRNQEPHRDKIILFSEWGDFATAQVAGRHASLDLALLWLPRLYGKASFDMPIREFSKIQEGEAVFLFGHPEGLLFSMSSGLVSRKDAAGLVQVSAPVSPGNSGGPIFDARGRLLGIVSWKVDKQTNPNAENLNFGVRADALLHAEGWKLNEAATTKLKQMREHSRKAGDGAPALLQGDGDASPDSGKKNQ